MSEDPQVVSISSNAPISPDEIGRKSFPVARKGVDGEAVRLYLAKVANELRGSLEREAQLRERLVEAERRAADPELDEATLTKAIGVETAKILQTAHEAARNVVEKAEEQAAELLGQANGVLAEQIAVAEAQATAIRVAAEQEAEEYSGRAQADANSMTEEAHADAVELLDATKEECRRMVAEARDLRNRTLADLVTRRRALRVQLEELRGGKDSLLSVVDSVAVTVDQLRDRLVAAEQQARVAAEEAGERAEEHAASDELGELEAELAAVGAALGDKPSAEGDIQANAVAAVASEPGTEPRAATDQSVEIGDNPSASRRSVDELFARIRASRAAEEAADAAAMSESAVVIETAQSDEAPDEQVVDETERPVTGAKPDLSETTQPGLGVIGAELARAEGTGEASEQTAEYVAVSVGLEVTEPADRSTLEETAASESAADGDDAAAAVVPGGSVFDIEALHPEGIDAGPGDSAVSGPEETSDAVAVAKAIEGDAITEPDVESLARRDHLLSPVTAKLGRALKRALQDDQNELLNALRQSTRKPVLDELVPVGVQLQRFVTAASEPLAKAYEAGAAFLVRGDAVEGPSVSAPAPSATTSLQAGTAIAAELADDLSAVLRQRIEEALSELDGTLEGSADAAGVAYREWKGSRVEGLAGDFTTRAFAVGELAVLESVAAGTAPLVRWAVEDDDGGGSCPDCDDNSLAGSLLPGSGFPTGHSHPPVHPGCRCLLVPVRS